MLLSPTEVKVRDLEYTLRIDSVNRKGWLVPLSLRQSRPNPLSTLLSSVTTRLAGLIRPVGLGTRPRKEDARSVA